MLLVLVLDNGVMLKWSVGVSSNSDENLAEAIRQGKSYVDKKIGNIDRYRVYPDHADRKVISARVFDGGEMLYSTVRVRRTRVMHITA